MHRKNPTTLISVFITTLFFTTLSFYVFHILFSGERVHLSSATLENRHLNYLLREDEHLGIYHELSSFIENSPPYSILLPDWEVLFVASPENPLFFNYQYWCLFQNNKTSPAKFSGVLQSSNRSTFKCDVPTSVRRFQPLLGPILTISQETWPEKHMSEMIHWNYLAYESLSTEEDVIVFVKGVNNRQGVNKSPEELSCVFGNGVNYPVKTAVTISSQEVFRCKHPNESEISQLFPVGDEKIKISLGVKSGEIVPSVAYYIPKHNIEHEEEGKSIVCACTMVHNVAKFLKEWVLYHSKLGVEKFILYDNDSEDDLQRVAKNLVKGNYNVKTILWPWPKTQEAGFSHSAIFAKGSCTWMMYMDVDEFVLSPSWLNSSYPSRNMLSSLLPRPGISFSSSPSLPPAASEKLAWLSLPVAQVSIRCLEFGPSNQQSHPIAGVTQGYTCRKRAENRHKSILLLDAVDNTLHNVIHHFKLKDGYRSRTLRLGSAVVNHYKYQAWSEFKAKFRRRVSAYVVDWRQEVNPMSKDRTPGLGFEAIEPEGWANKFCDVNDYRLKMATQRWFILDSSIGSKLAWQD